MQILLGVDRKGDTAAETLVKRLRFPEPVIDLIHVIPPYAWGPTGMYGGVPAEAAWDYSDYLAAERQAKEEARNLLCSRSSGFADEEGKCITSVCSGNPTEMLLEHADINGADLIAVNAAHQNPILAFLTGSVARGLVIGANQSVLLARGNGLDTMPGRHPLRAVLATDHSPYMNRCIEKLIQFHPQGLQHVTVLSTFPQAEMKELKNYLPHLAVNPVEAMQHELLQRNEELIQRLKERFGESGTTFSSWVSGEPVNDAIERAMEETESDLLILGAQGHSFLKRLSLGSVSFHQAMAESYSVLVLRANEGAADAIPVTSTIEKASLSFA